MAERCVIWQIHVSPSNYVRSWCPAVSLISISAGTPLIDFYELIGVNLKQVAHFWSASQIFVFVHCSAFTKK